MNNIKELVDSSRFVNLLYVEDNLATREAASSFFKDFFDNIIVSENGEKGLEQFILNKIDIVITDIRMPIMNGLEMIESIRRIDSEVPILIFSGQDVSLCLKKSINLGVSGFIDKPINIDKFSLTLKKALNSSKIKGKIAQSSFFLKQYGDAVDKNAIVSKTDINGVITYVNDKFCDISGYTRKELLNKPHSIVRHPDVSPAFFSDIWETIKEKKEIWIGGVKNLNKNKTSYYTRTLIKPILNMDNEIVEFISIRSIDSVSISPKQQLQELIDSSERMMIAIIKIENFEDIEKFYGAKLSHILELRILRKISEIISRDRIFNNVFALGDGVFSTAESINDKKIDSEQVCINLKELQSEISESDLNINSMEHEISVVISLAIGKEAFSNAKYGLKEIIRNQQSFLYLNDESTKGKGKCSALANLNTLKMVKKAIKDFKIVSYFQPIIDNKTQEIAKYESLVRLIDCEGKVISPGFFLDVAKKAKYYSQITYAVLEHSFAALKLTKKDISINISAIDIEKKETRRKIYELLEENASESHRIVFELLEDENAKDFNTVISFIQNVKKKGVQIAIDDFGAGYSNFERLLSYQPDILKIDGCLVKNIVSDSYSFNVIETIVGFAKKENLKVIAEYVESEEIYDALCGLGVDYSQGYYFGKPDTVEVMA